jgi:regulation of enolase protein 1 (concanavalin A-like superfamily)
MNSRRLPAWQSFRRVWPVGVQQAWLRDPRGFSSKEFPVSLRTERACIMWSAIFNSFTAHASSCGRVEVEKIFSKRLRLRLNKLYA